MPTRKQRAVGKGRWFYWQMDRSMPDVLDVFEGGFDNRRKVATITRYQAMAYYRHWNNGGVYYSVRLRGSGFTDIRVGGDIDAFYEDAT